MQTTHRHITPIIAVLCLAAAAAPAAVLVAPPGAIVAGKTIGEWSAAWWQWGVALAPPGDPFTDYSGAYAGVNQSGPVFFLAGSPGGNRSRWFEVPTNTYVLVPLLTGELSQLELGFDKSAAEIRQAALEQANLIDSLHATLDGVTIPQATLFGHREASPDFNFDAVAYNQLGVPPGGAGIAVADGFFLMLDPLPPGIHVLTYGGGVSAFGIAISETDTITVGVPEFTLQPTNQTVLAGQSANFAVGTSGSPPLSYQWYYNSFLVLTNTGPIGTPVNNATASTLMFTATPSSAGYYWVTVSNIASRVTSSPAYLTVLPGPPTLSGQRYGDALVLNWSDPAFSLQAAPAVAGTYTNIPGAISPYTNAISHLKGSFD